MGDLRSSSLSGNGIENLDSSLRGDGVELSEPSRILASLRRNLSEGLQPPAAILHATAEAARVLARADGAALALRTKGVIVCRACSGDPAPDLGSPLNTDSGISGECLRAAVVLVCDDAENDPRVDPDVCRYLGIRSIAVVPLRGPSGIAGILEAFSTRPCAFGEPQINFLRELAAIAETAYGREMRGLQESPAPAPKATPIRIFSNDASEAATRQSLDDPSPARRVWFVGGLVVVMLLAAGVWLSGHEPGLETSAKEPVAVHSADATEPGPVLVPAAVPKPKAGIARLERSAAETVRLASQIEIIDDTKPIEALSEGTPSAPSRSTSPESRAISNPDPPGLTTGSNDSAESGALPSILATRSDPLPPLDAPVSQGITAGKLIHKVEPVYPAEARVRKLSGSVALEITIAADGRVSEVKQDSGNSLLASAAGAAIRQWRYSPFLLNGKPVEVQKRITVLFKLPVLDARR